MACEWTGYGVYHPSQFEKEKNVSTEKNLLCLLVNCLQKNQTNKHCILLEFAFQIAKMP